MSKLLTLTVSKRLLQMCCVGVICFIIIIILIPHPKCFGGDYKGASHMDLVHFSNSMSIKWTQNIQFTITTRYRDLQIWAKKGHERVQRTPIETSHAILGLKSCIESYFPVHFFYKLLIR